MGQVRNRKSSLLGSIGPSATTHHSYWRFRAIEPRWPRVLLQTEDARRLPEKQRRRTTSQQGERLCLRFSRVLLVGLLSLSPAHAFADPTEEAGGLFARLKSACDANDNVAGGRHDRPRTLVRTAGNGQ